MVWSEEDLARAEAEMARLRGATATAVAARYDRRIGRVVIQLSSGLEVAFSPRDAQGLESAKPSDLNVVEVSPSGLGLHFPKIDADLYLPTLLRGLLGSREWMAEHLRAQRSGSSRTAAA